MRLNPNIAFTSNVAKLLNRLLLSLGVFRVIWVTLSSTINIETNVLRWDALIVVNIQPGNLLMF